MQKLSKSKIKSSKYVQNYTEFAQNGRLSPVAGFETDLAKVERILTAATKKNPVIVDEFSGKSQVILVNLAARLLVENAPANLRGKKSFENGSGSDSFRRERSGASRIDSARRFETI